MVSDNSFNPNVQSLTMTKKMFNNNRLQKNMADEGNTKNGLMSREAVKEQRA